MTQPHSEGNEMIGNDPDIFSRLRHMNTHKGQSLSQLENEVCDVAERLRSALATMVDLALNYFSVEGAEGDAIDAANEALVSAGDPEALAALEAWQRLGTLQGSRP